MSDPIVLSIQVGRPVEMGDEGATDPIHRRWASGLVKCPVDGPVWLGRTNLDGDGQATSETSAGRTRRSWPTPPATTTPSARSWPGRACPSGPSAKTSRSPGGAWPGQPRGGPAESGGPVQDRLIDLDERDRSSMEPKGGRLGPPYRNVIFDLDGTLIDSRPGILAGIRHALGRLGHDLPGDIDLTWAVGPPLEEVVARLLSPLGDERINQAVSFYREYYGDVGLFDAYPYEGIPTLLGDLAAAGRSLFVGTSKLAPFARTVLGHFGLADNLTGIYGTEPDGRLRYKADLIRQILDDCRLAPTETVMVGDREHNVIGARANDVDVVSVTYGYGTTEELLAAGATVLCAAPWRLRDLL